MKRRWTQKQAGAMRRVRENPRVTAGMTPTGGKGSRAISPVGTKRRTACYRLGSLRLNCGSSRSRSAIRARKSLLLSVPRGKPSTSAICR